jgi:hypothetical protein
MAMLFVLLGFAVVSCYQARVFPLFILCLVVWLVAIVPAFYVEVIDKE